MAKRPKTTAEETEVTEEQVGGIPPYEPSADEVAAAADIESVLGDPSLSSGYVRIMLRRPGKVEATGCGKVAVNEFDLDTIVEKFGGGDYTFYFCVRGRVLARRSFKADERIKGTLSTDQQAAVSSGGNGENHAIEVLAGKIQAGGQAGAGVDPALLGMLQAQQSAMIAVVTKALDRPPPPPPPSLAQQLSPLLTAFAPAIAELIKSKASPMSETLSLLKTAKSLVRGGTDDDDDDDEGKGFLGRLAEALVPVLAKTMAPGAATVPITQPELLPSPTPVAPAALPAPPATGNNSSTRLQGGVNSENLNSIQRSTTAAAPVKSENPMQDFIPILIRAANNDTPPESYADVILDAVDDAQFYLVTSALSHPDWLVLVFQNHPDVIAKLPWFERLRALLLEAAEPEEEGEGEEEPKPGPAPAEPIPLPEPKPKVK